MTSDALNHRMDRVGRAEALAKIGNWEWDLVGNASTWSDGLFRIYGRNKADGVPAFDAWRETIHPDDEELLAEEISKSKDRVNDYSLEFRIHTKDTGELKYIASRGSSTTDDQGRLIRIWGVDQDITERKKAELALQTSLHEKEALLREVHHRVKNNLQIVTSLLRLEAGRSNQPETKIMLGDMQGRIRAMALLHESLYRKGTFATVELGAYLRNLATQAVRSLAPPGGDVKLVLELDAVQVSLDQATPVGLLLNELMSNAFKHGFPQGHRGEVRVALHAAFEGHPARLTVSDSGVGLPADFDARKSQSMGLKLVADLARQLGGDIIKGPGQTFEMCFTPAPPILQPDGMAQ